MSPAEQLAAVSLAALEMVWGLEVDRLLNERSGPLAVFVGAVVRRHHPEVIYTALVYCLRLREGVSARIRLWQARRHPLTAALCCRRMFLAAVMSASKFLLDRATPNRAWAKLVGLGVAEIARSEYVFLVLIGHRLHVHPADLYSAVCTLAQHLQATHPITHFIARLFETRRVAPTKATPLVSAKP